MTTREPTPGESRSVPPPAMKYTFSYRSSAHVRKSRNRSLVGARVVEDEHIARVDIGQRQREGMDIGGGARLDEHEIVVAERGREPLEPWDHLRVLDMFSNPQRRGQKVISKQDRGNDADCRE